MDRLRTPAMRFAATAAAVGMLAMLSACEKPKGRSGSGNGLPVLGSCEGNKAVKVNGHTTLAELISRHTSMTDGLYGQNGFIDRSHAIAVSRSKAAALGKKAGKFTIYNYTWFEHAPEPKPGSVVYVPRTCYDKANKPKE